MTKRYQINTVAISRFGGNLALIDVEMKTTTRRFLMDEDCTFIPLDGKAISGALLSALAEDNATAEYSKYWLLNAQRQLTNNDIAWANDFASKSEEWDC